MYVCMYVCLYIIHIYIIIQYVTSVLLSASVDCYFNTKLKLYLKIL